MAAEHATSTLSIRHILVVVCGILMLLGPCALVYNTWSIFVVPVSNSLGVATTQFTFYITVVYLIGAFAAPLAGNLLERFDLRWVLSASVLLVSIGIFCCSFWTEAWQFYISGLIEGLGIVALMFLAVPTLINRWFTQRTGLLIGLCLAMSGIGGALWSMVGGAIIASSDWRDAYTIFALINTVLALPATLFFIRSYPQDVGLLPYGGKTVQKPTKENESHDACPGNFTSNDTSSASPDNAEPAPGASEQPHPKTLMEWGVSAKTMFKSPIFFVLVIAVSLLNALTAVGNLIATYIYHLGDLGVAGITPESAIMMASTAAACLMIFAAIGKVTLGALSDKSLVGAVLLAGGAGMAGTLCIWQTSSWSFALYIGACMFGFLYAAVDALGPTITRAISGPRDYTLIYSRVAIFINVGGALAVVLFTALSEVSWNLEWIVTLTLTAVSTLLCLYVARWGKRPEQTLEEKKID